MNNSPQSLLLRLVAVGLLCYALMSYGLSLRELQREQLRQETLQAECDLLTAGNEERQARLIHGHTPEELETLAGERLGLIRPGEKIFLFEQEQSPHP